MIFGRGQFMVAICCALTLGSWAKGQPTDARPAPAGADAAAQAMAAPPATQVPASPQENPSPIAAAPSPQQSPAPPAALDANGGNDFDRSGVEGRPLGRGATVTAADTGGEQKTERVPTGSSAWWQTLGALLLVIALIFAMRWALRRTGNLRAAVGGGKQIIEILSRTPISARQSLLLVRVGPRVLVVGAGESLTTLAEINDPAQVTDLMGSVEQARANSLTNSFARALGQWRSSTSQILGGLDESDGVGDGHVGDGNTANQTPAARAADRLRSMAQKVRDIGTAFRRRP